jgi:hypothetical protein
MSAPAPDPAAAPAPEAAVATAPTPEVPETDKGSEELEPAEKEALAVQRFVDHLNTETGMIARLKSISKVINASLRQAEPEDRKNFYTMLRSLAISKLTKK